MSEEWNRRLEPLTFAEADRIASRDFSGRSVAARSHLVGDAIPVFGAFARAGAAVTVCPCNVDSTDPDVVAALRDCGVTVHGEPGMSAEADAQALASVAIEATDVISDMGGELIVAANAAGRRPRGALEATGSGILRLEAAEPAPFPVFNWDDVRLKEGLHNRFHVGATIWPAFEAVTGMNLFMRRVVVLGFGPVGRGVALRALALGALVTVIEPDPVRRVEAAHSGMATGDAAEALRHADVVATATGRTGVLGPDQLVTLKDGAVLLNCGHAGAEIDVSWLDRQPSRQVGKLIRAHDLGDATVYLLNRGNLLNLAPGYVFGADLFDPFGALMLIAIEWLLDTDMAHYPKGLQALPGHIERRVAESIWQRQAVLR